MSSILVSGNVCQRYKIFFIVLVQYDLNTLNLNFFVFSHKSYVSGGMVLLAKPRLKHAVFFAAESYGECRIALRLGH
jgi:hypothetical protein